MGNQQPSYFQQQADNLYLNHVQQKQYVYNANGQIIEDRPARTSAPPRPPQPRAFLKPSNTYVRPENRVLPFEIPEARLRLRHVPEDMRSASNPNLLRRNSLTDSDSDSDLHTSGDVSVHNSNFVLRRPDHTRSLDRAALQTGVPRALQLDIAPPVPTRQSDRPVERRRKRTAPAPPPAATRSSRPVSRQISFTRPVQPQPIALFQPDSNDFVVEPPADYDGNNTWANEIEIEKYGTQVAPLSADSGFVQSPFSLSSPPPLPPKQHTPNPVVFPPHLPSKQHSIVPAAPLPPAPPPPPLHPLSITLPPVPSGPVTSLQQVGTVENGHVDLKQMQQTGSRETGLNTDLKEELIAAAARRATRPPIRDSQVRKANDADVLREQLRRAYRARKQRIKVMKKGMHVEKELQCDSRVDTAHFSESDSEDKTNKGRSPVHSASHSPAHSPLNQLAQQSGTHSPQSPKLSRFVLTSEALNVYDKPRTSITDSPIAPSTPELTKAGPPVAPKPNLSIYTPKGFKRPQMSLQRDWTPADDLDDDDDRPQRAFTQSDAGIPNFSRHNQRSLTNLSDSDASIRKNKKKSMKESVKNVFNSLGRASGRLLKGESGSNRGKLRDINWQSSREQADRETDSSRWQYPFEGWDARQLLESAEDSVTMMKCYAPDGSLVLVPQKAVLQVTDDGRVVVPRDSMRQKPKKKKPSINMPSLKLKRKKDKSREAVRQVNDRERSRSEERLREQQADEEMARIRYMQQDRRQLKEMEKNGSTSPERIINGGHTLYKHTGYKKRSSTDTTQQFCTNDENNSHLSRVKLVDSATLEVDGERLDYL